MAVSDTIEWLCVEAGLSLAELGALFPQARALADDIQQGLLFWNEVSRARAASAANRSARRRCMRAC